MTDRAALLAQRRRITAAAAARRPKAVPAPAAPTGLVLSHTRLMLGLSRAMDAAVMEAVKSTTPRADAAEGDVPGRAYPSEVVARVVARIRAALGKIAGASALTRQLGALASRVGTFTRQQWNAQLKRAMGIDLSAEPDLARLMDAFRTRNVALIKSLAGDKVARVRTVLVAAGTGARVEEVASRIRAETGATESRAALIARDQVLTLNSEVMQARHQAAGITQFRWSTSRDERVRQSHRELEGKVFSYADPPVVDGEPTVPGQGIQCRCTATPILPGMEP